MSQLNVDNIRNRTGSNGGPNFPSGITVAVGQTAYIHGNLQVDGTETIVNTETLNVADKTVGIGSTSNASNTTADGSGIEVFASSSQTGNNKTLTWSNTSNSWEFGPNDVGLKVGTGITVYGETGIVSATSFKGDGSQLTGIDATAIQTGNTSVQTVDTGSDGHVKMTTEGGERVRVGPAGQIGLGGANYGTSGQVITSAGTGSAPSWAAIPPGGNVITAEAEGAIAVGKCVQIRTDGKVEQIAESSQAAGPGNASLGPEEWVSDGNNDNIKWTCTVVDPDASRAIAYFQGNNDDISCTNVPINASGGLGARTQTFLKVDSSAQGQVDNPRHTWSACYDTTNDKHLCVWATSGSGGAIHHKTGTMQGAGGIVLDWGTLGTVVAGVAGNTPSVVFDSATGRMVLVYRRSSDWYPQVVIGSYNSGTGSYDWGTPVTIASVGMSADIQVCKAGSTTGTYAVFWKRNSDNNCRGNLITVSSSSNTCTVSSDANVVAVGSLYYEVAYDENADRINMVYHRPDTGRMYIQRVKRNSGNTAIEIDGSSAEVISQQAGQDIMIAYSPAALRCYCWWRDPSYGSATRWKFLSNTTGTPTFGGETSPSNNPDTNSNGLGYPDVDPTTGNIYFCVDHDSNNRGQMWSITTTAEVSNRSVANHYLGFADQAYTDGQTATIKTYGNNTSDLSGLTIGTKYYVQNDGTVATGTASPSALAGLAISATKLLIMEPKADV